MNLTNLYLSVNIVPTQFLLSYRIFKALCRLRCDEDIDIILNSIDSLNNKCLYFRNVWDY